MNVPRTHNSNNPAPLIAHNTIAAVLDSIATAIDGDGLNVDSIDSGGMSIVVDGLRLRLEITLEEPVPIEDFLEDTPEAAREWHRANRERFDAWRSTNFPDRKAYIEGRDFTDDADLDMPF